MGKGSQTTTNSTTSSADPQAEAAYRALISQATGVASTPYQAYSGQLVAPINSQQQTGIDNINSNANYAQPYIQQGADYANQSAQAITPEQIAQYQNPYTQQVVNATQAQFDNQNQQAQQGLTSNAIAQGALGGNRTGVASANLAGQQQTAQAPVIAGLYNQSYNQALGAAQQDAQRQAAAGYSLGNLGVAGQSAALSGAGAQLGAGTLQQQTQQQQDTANYGQYSQQQAYPFQTLQWLAGLQTGVGSQLGGTSTGQTTTPPPNPWGQIAGLGLAAASFMKDGGRVRPGFDSGGGVAGTPWADAKGWVPSMQISAGRGAPAGSAPAPAKDQGIDPQSIIKQATGLSGLFGKFSGPSYGGGNVFNSEWGGSSSSPLEGLDASDYGPGFRTGGGVAGFADGGAPSFDDRFTGGLGMAPFLSGDFTAGDPAFDEPPKPPTSFDDRFIGDGSRPGLVPTEDPRVVNPDDPIRMPDQKSIEDWRGNTPMYTDNGPAPGGVAPVVAKDDADDGPLPLAPPAAGGVGAAPPPTSAPEAFSPDRVPYAKSGGLGLLNAIGLDPSDAARSGLLATGLGLLSSRSPNLGNALGDAGQIGMATYSGARKGEVDAATEARKLSDAASKAAKDIELRTRALTETERHNKASEAKEFKPTFGVIGEDVDPVTGIGKKRYGWIDPNNRSTSAAPGNAPVAPGSNPVGKAAIDPSLSGADYIAALEKTNPEYARTVKALGDYKISLTSMSNRGGMRERLAEAALRYNPDYDQTNFSGKSRAVSNFSGGPEGRTVRSLNVAMDHLGTLQEAADALNNGQVPVFNRIVNAYKQQTGSPVTTNFDSIKQVVSAEIAKSVVGGQTALHDREDMAQRAANSQSPAQLTGIITEFKKLMAGQMKGLRRSYETSTKLKNFDDFLEPSTKRELERVSAHEGGGGGGDGGGAKAKRVTQGGYTYELGPDGKYHPVQ